MNKSKILIKLCACSSLVLGGLLLVASPVFADLSDDTNNLKSQWSGACAQSGGNAPGCGGGSSDTSSSSGSPAAAPAPAPSPSPMQQAELGAAQQIGYSIGQNIAQALFGSPQTPEQQAAQQEQQREIAAQKAYAAQQAAIAEQQRQEEIARQQQATHDRLVSEMQSDDGTSYGIKGLPGIYLNNSSSNQQGLQLMKDGDSESSANAQVNTNPTSSNENTAAAASNNTENEGGVQLMKDDDSTSSAPSNPSPAVPPQAQDGLNLMKDDDGSSNAPPENQSGQKAVDFSGVPIKDAHLQDDQAAVPSDSSVVDLRDAHTTTVDPSVVNGSSPSFSTINPSPADQALMRHQSGGLDFMYPGTDTHVVDARVPSDLPKSVDNSIASLYSTAPSGVSERVRKGFQAVMAHDWKLAKAWFGDALNHDPDNASLKNFVELADYKADHSTSPANHVQLPQDSDIQFLFPDDKPAKPMELPKDSDIEFLFPGYLEAEARAEAKEMNDYMFSQALINAENDPVLKKLGAQIDSGQTKAPIFPKN